MKQFKEAVQWNSVDLNDPTLNRLKIAHRMESFRQNVWNF